MSRSHKALLLNANHQTEIYCGLLIAQNVGKELNEISIKTTVDIADRR